MASSSDDQCHHGGATFNSLPDELVLKIVKLAAQSEYRLCFSSHDSKYIHKYILNIVGKISVRFRNIAADKSLWRGYVFIGNRPGYGLLDDVSEEGIASLVRDFLCEESKLLEIQNLRKRMVDGRWTPVDGEVIRSETIRALSEKCPDMIALSLNGLRMESWPSPPYNSLDSLEDLVMGRLQLSSDLFRNVHLHECFPNLKSVILDRCEAIGGGAIALPDASECRSLEVFEIRNGIYRFATDLDVKVPFPQSLKKWVFWPVRIYDFRGREFDKNTSRFHEYLMDLMRDHMKDCEINAWLQSE